MLCVMQRLQHEPIPAQRHDHLRLFQRHITIAPNQCGTGVLSNRRVTGSKGDFQAHGAKFPIGRIYARNNHIIPHATSIAAHYV